MVQVARRLHVVDAAPMTYFAGFEPWLRANNCGNNTIEDRLNHLADFARAHPGFPHVTPTDITSWLGRPGYAQWTRATYYGHLHSYYAFATDVGFVEVDPMARMRHPKPGKSVPRPLSPAQVAVVLSAATNVNLHAWLILGLYAGLRAHEIAKIRGEDVDQEQLFVFGKGGQGAFVPTHPLVWELAQTRPRQGWWFPSSASSLGHVRSTSVSTGITRLFAANGIEGSIHRCRHTYATQLLRAGVNIRVVQSLMRHASLNSTMIYTAVDEDERRDAINRLAA
jgi:site-specific recombinase XerD